MSDIHGYSFTFLVTIAMQALGTLLYCTLVTVVISSRPEDFMQKKNEGVAVKTEVE